MSTINELYRSYIQQHRNGGKLPKNRTIKRVFSMVLRDEAMAIARLVGKTFNK